MEDRRNKGKERAHGGWEVVALSYPTPEAIPDLSTEHSPAPPWSSRHHTPPGRAAL